MKQKFNEYFPGTEKHPIFDIVLECEREGIYTFEGFLQKVGIDIDLDKNLISPITYQRSASRRGKSKKKGKVIRKRKKTKDTPRKKKNKK